MQAASSQALSGGLGWLKTRRVSPLWAALCTSTVIVGGVSPALAATFCVDDQPALEAALAEAARNAADDLIQLVDGAVLEPTALPNEMGYRVRVEGGYSANCSVRAVLPAPAAEQQLLQSVAAPPTPQQSTTGPVPPPTVAPKSVRVPFARLTGAAELVTLGVPGYDWHHGCGPTAVGMVIGYYDGRGCGLLFDGDAESQTNAVDQGMASEGSSFLPRHYEDYSLPMDSATPTMLADRSEDPVWQRHAGDSIADFMKTSWSSENNRYGWSWSNHIVPAFANYVGLRNGSYAPAGEELLYGSGLTWTRLTTEIDAGRPMVFLVDTDGNGGTDHFITVIGYQSVGSSRYYGALDTWAPAQTIRWESFRQMANGSAWGISRGYSFSLACVSDCGDADGSGNVSIVDALAIARHVAGLPPPPTVDTEAADVNADGSATIVDALLIARSVAGLPVTGTCLAP